MPRTLHRVEQFNRVSLARMPKEVDVGVGGKFMKGFLSLKVFPFEIEDK